jgi:hypothetical protein
MAQRRNRSRRQTDKASNREQKRRFWRRTIDQWRRSRLTVRAFCERRGLSEPSFYYWRRRVGTTEETGSAASAGHADDLGATAAGAGFAEVQVVGDDRPAGSEDPVVELILPAGERLRVEAGVTPEHLRRVLTAVREARGC